MMQNIRNTYTVWKVSVNVAPDYKVWYIYWYIIWKSSIVRGVKVKSVQSMFKDKCKNTLSIIGCLIMTADHRGVKVYTTLCMIQANQGKNEASFHITNEIDTNVFTKVISKILCVCLIQSLVFTKNLVI